MPLFDPVMCRGRGFAAPSGPPTPSPVICGVPRRPEPLPRRAKTRRTKLKRRLHPLPPLLPQPLPPQSSATLAEPLCVQPVSPVKPTSPQQHRAETFNRQSGDRTERGTAAAVHQNYVLEVAAELKSEWLRHFLQQLSYQPLLTPPARQPKLLPRLSPQAAATALERLGESPMATHLAWMQVLDDGDGELGREAARLTVVSGLYVAARAEASAPPILAAAAATGEDTRAFVGRLAELLLRRLLAGIATELGDAADVAAGKALAFDRARNRYSATTQLQFQ